MEFGLFHVRTLRKVSQRARLNDEFYHPVPDRITRKQHISERQALPEKYLGLSDEEMSAASPRRRETLGDRLSFSGITISATK